MILNSILPEELLARYIFDKNHYRQNGTVHYNAFMPNRNNETSVFRIEGLDQKNIWDIGQDVAKLRLKALLGRADIFAKDTSDKNLKIKSAEPPPRHANIIWFIGKSERKEIAMELAALSKLHLLKR